MQTDDRGGETSGSATKIIRDPQAIQEKFMVMIAAARREVLLLLPTQAAFYREKSMGALDLLVGDAAKGVRVRIVSPVDAEIRALTSKLNDTVVEAGGRPLELTEASEAKSESTVTLLVVDKDSSLVVEQRDPLAKEFVRAVGAAVFSEADAAVRANESFFERVREESSLRRREEEILRRERNNKRQAELLQDILAHDIRNYNQIILSNAEVLRDTLPGAQLGSVEAIMRATEGSTGLVERAVKFSKIVASPTQSLSSVVVEDSIARSLALIGKAYSPKSLSVACPVKSRSLVMADELLDEVFINILSNSAKYTPSDDVPIEITIGTHRAGADHPIREPDQVKVSIGDHGRGIPESIRSGAFNRYQTSASGTGLGLSIVRALVVDRYGGTVELADRVRGDRSSGTRVDVMLRAAQPPGRSGFARKNVGTSIRARGANSLRER